jgi:uncharacterized membrane protein YjfL (UPF0719 family)
MLVFPTDESPITAILANASNSYLLLVLFSMLEFFISKYINYKSIQKNNLVVQID